jgi:hypothetical protein
VVLTRRAGRTEKDTWNRPWIVAAFFLVATIIMTWPLVTVLPRQIAGDLGDPLFNSWVLRWTSGQVLAALHGDLAALSLYWQGNIFYPSPLTLAYSEHLTPQMLQILPVMAATDNVILCYNLQLLVTFVLSGLGMYLFVRELTGQPLAAVFAGVAFAFAPFRVAQYSHLEVLSSQWMPFTLYGFRRFFVTARWRPLLGGTAALVAQGLSCGYYLAYFTPFAVAYCVYEMVVRGTLSDGPTWRALLGAGGVALLVTAFFLWPYLQVRLLADTGVRDPAEIQELSADTHAFATISENSRLWGSRIRAWPRVQGLGFPGFAILLFAAAACGIGVVRAGAHARRAGLRQARWRHAPALLLGVTLIALLVVLGHTLVTGRLMMSIAGITVSKRSTMRLLAEIVAVVSASLIVSPVLRRIARGVPESTLGFFAGAAMASAWLSLGPTMYANGNDIGPGLYNVFYRWVPGFDGLRVVTLYFMLVAFFLAVLAGLGAASLIAGGHRAGRLLVGVGMIAIMAESWSVPTPLNVRYSDPRYALPRAEITVLPQLSGAYQMIRYLPADTVLAEFPLGPIPWEIQYTFYAGYHRKPIVNGYSGFYPSSYVRLVGPLSHRPSGDEAWNALISSGATHAIVHEDAFLDDEGIAISAWLRQHGAHQVVIAERDRLFRLR